ncbi:MAG TPA: hypothetical protein VFU15_02095, partial [Bacteroidia bacterium]|nr:hypothetical protein [Bacteroidia bacterium]
GLEFPVVILPFASWDFKVQKKEIWITPEDELVPELETALVSTGKNLLKTKIAGRYTTEETRSHLDMLNLLYVAMTRPEKRLYVFTGKVKEIKSPPVNVSQCFAFYLQTLKAEGDCFESGTREKPSHAGPPVSRVISAPAGDPVSWYHRVKIRSLASDFGDGETRTNAAKGKMLHRVLSLLKDRTGADEAIRKAAALGWIPEDDRDYFLREVNGILSIPELEECFDTTGNFIERKILVPGSGNYRPDRVTIKKEKCIVLDYKTGKALPAHRAQLDGYGDLLKKMGYREIEKKLVYTENGEVISWQ